MRHTKRLSQVQFAVASVLLLTLATLGSAGAVTLHPGDILIGDPGAVAIIRVDPATGAQTIVSSGGNMVSPMGLALDTAGNILVADDGAAAVLRIDPATGVQMVVSSGGLFVRPSDLTIDAAGQILVVDADAFGPDEIAGGTGGVIRVDPLTGAQTTVSSGDNFHGPTGIALDAAGHILVADVDFGGSPGVSGPGAIIRVDPTTGAQTVVSTGGTFVGPVRVAVAPTGQIFVSDHGSFRTGTTIGAIFGVDPATGAQTVIYNSFGGGPIQGPEGIALDATGQILVAFKGHPDFDVPDGVARIDPATGAVTVISSGGTLVGPFGIAVVPGPSPACDPLVADAGPDQTVRSGEFITFDFSHSPCIDAAVDIRWDFDDGQVATGALVRHRFSEPGVYEVSLTIEDSFGRTVIDATLITVRPVRVTVAFSEVDNFGFEHSARATASYVWMFDVANGPLYSVRGVGYESTGVIYAQLFILSSEGDLLTLPNGCVPRRAIAQKFVTTSTASWRPGVDVFPGSALAMRAFFIPTAVGVHGPPIPRPQFRCPSATFAPP